MSKNQEQLLKLVDPDWEPEPSKGSLVAGSGRIDLSHVKSLKATGGAVMAVLHTPVDSLSGSMPQVQESSLEPDEGNEL